MDDDTNAPLARVPTLSRASLETESENDTLVIDPGDHAWFEPKPGSDEEAPAPKWPCPIEPTQIKPKNTTRVSVLLTASGAHESLIRCVQTLSKSDLRAAGQLQITVAPYGESISALRYRQLLKPYPDIALAFATQASPQTRLDALRLAFFESTGHWIISMDAADQVGPQFADQLLADALERQSKMVLASCGFIQRERLVRSMGPAFDHRLGDIGLADLGTHVDGVRALLRRDVWDGVYGLVSKVTEKALRSSGRATKQSEDHSHPVRHLFGPEVVAAWDHVADILMHIFAVYVCGRSAPISTAQHLFNIPDPAPDRRMPRNGLHHEVVAQWWGILRERWTLPSVLDGIAKEYMLAHEMYSLQEERRTKAIPSYQQFLASLDLVTKAA